tara:strand:+ start:166 stop:1533 length:1368 start_codon:yes stop_codon:yes gene_type:complete
MKKPKGPVNIKLQNALNYPVDPDRDYRVADTTKHLKLRVLPSGYKYWEYDYIWKGVRNKQEIGPLDGPNAISPTKAREMVNGWEHNRKVRKIDPFTKAAKGISLSSIKDDYFNWRRIKPATTGKGVVTGLSEAEYKERQRRFKRHFEGEIIAETSLLDLTLQEISSWFDGLVSEKPVEALACLFLAKNMTKFAMKQSDELAQAISNKFELAVDEDELKEIRQAIDENRTKRPISKKEYQAIWEACDESADQLDGLIIQFIAATALRGKHAGDLLKADIQQADGKYFFTAKFKKNVDTVVLTETAEGVYNKLLALHKEQGWVTEFLFPSLNWTGGKYQGPRNRGMNKDDRKRAWTGNHGSGGIRAKAAKKEPSILGIKSKTQAEKERYGEWKLKPIGLHDIRDTFATEAEDSMDATNLLQNKKVSVTDKHYRETRLSEKIAVADKKQAIIRKLRDE